MIKNQKECPKMSQLQERRLLEKNTSASDKNDAIKCREDFHKKCRRGKCIGLYAKSNAIPSFSHKTPESIPKTRKNAVVDGLDY